MIGSAGIRATRTRSEEAPLVRRWTLARRLRIPLELRLSSMYVETHPADEYACNDGANARLQLSSVIPGDGLWENVRVQDVMSTVDGRFCYVYA